MNQPAKRQNRIIILLAISFSLFLVGVVVLANRGELDRYSSFLTSQPFGDKIGHFLLMGTLSLLVNLSLMAKRFQFVQRRFLVGSFVIVVVVTAEELSQAFISSRVLSLGDWMADLAGIFLFGQIAAYIVSKQGRSVERRL